MSESPGSTPGEPDTASPAEPPVVPKPAPPVSAEPEPAEPEPAAEPEPPTEPEPEAVEPAPPAEPEPPAVPVAPAALPPVPTPAALARPRPAPPLTPAPVAPALPAAAAVAGDPTAYGRVDADGTVYVRLPDGGEHAVGQWAAGEPEEGLAFFARKYADVAVEVDLATRRLQEGKAGAEQAEAVVRRAREALATPAMVGDLGQLDARVATLHELVEQRRGEAVAEKAAAKARILQAREAIAVEAESLAESTQWKVTGERFKELLEQWKSTPRADRGSEQELWKRFSHARSVFDKRRRQHFAKLDGERGESRQVKEALVKEAEALSTSKEWGPTAAAYRDLMARWKAAGRAGKADEERLWARFRAAQDSFFEARSSVFTERDAEQKTNLQGKLALLTEAEAIDTADLAKAKAALRSVQERWEAIGHVPRADKEPVEGRLRRVEETIRRGDQEQWRRTNPEARARAEDTVAKFQASVAKLESDRDAAKERGDDRSAADLQARIDSTRALLAAAENAARDFGG